MVAKDIGRRVRGLRRARGWTMKALAVRAGLDQSAISRLENGERDFYFGTFVRIVEALRVPAFRLYMTDKEWAKWKR